MESEREPTGALLELDWLREANQYFITISDFESMSESNTEDFILFDRNWQDITSNNKRGKIYRPQDYFKNNYHIKYTHIHGIFGKFEWVSKNEPLTKSYSIPNKTYLIGRMEYEQIPDIEYRYWEINCAPNYWYPLTDGKLKRKLPEYEPPFPDNINEKYWYEFPKTTHVGWRGNMMRLHDLNKMPNIWHD